MTQRERLHDKSLDTNFPGFLSVNLPAVACKQDDGDIRTDLNQLPGQFFACHSRHGHVRYDQIKVLRSFPKFIQSLQAVAICYDLVAEMLQRLPANGQQFFFVINEKDAFGASR